MKMVENSLKVQKLLWEKEKLLITSNFSFSQRVFKRLVLQTSKNKDLFETGLNARLTYSQVAAFYDTPLSPLDAVPL